MKSPAQVKLVRKLVIVLVCTMCSNTLSSPSVNVFETIQSMLVRIEKISPGLKKSQAEGQNAIIAFPNSIPNSGLTGLKVTIGQYWNIGSIPNGWANSIRSTRDYDIHNEPASDTSFGWDSTGKKWSLEYETDYTYYAFGRISAMTNQYYNNGKWMIGDEETFSYDAQDSLWTFEVMNWDTVSKAWQSPSVIGKVAYNQNHRVDTISANSPDATILVAFSYFPDGKLLSENENITYFTPSRYVHYYPNANTELVVYQYQSTGIQWTTTDSAKIVYSNAGLAVSRRDYVPNASGDSVLLFSSDSTNLDSLERPLIAIHSSYEEKNQRPDMPDSTRTLFYYSSTGVINPKLENVLEKTVPGIKSMGSREIFITGLAKEARQVNLAIYNNLGQIVYKSIVNSASTNATVVSLNKPLSKGCYFGKICCQGQKSTIAPFVAF